MVLKGKPKSHRAHASQPRGVQSIILSVHPLAISPCGCLSCPPPSQSPPDFKPFFFFFLQWLSGRMLWQEEAGYQDPGEVSVLNSASLQGLMQPVVVITSPSNWQSCHRRWLLPPASRETCKKSLYCCWEIVFQKGISS